MTALKSNGHSRREHITIRQSSREITLKKESEKVGPLTSTADALTEEEQNNTPPVPVNPVIEETVKIWPFVGGSFTLDMNTLATDAQDSTLRYKIESTSFIEGMDYTVDNNGS